MNKYVIDTETCEYCDCVETATVWHEELQAWLCEKHDNSVSNSTGYCPVSCQLGYGCDQSC